MATNFPASLDNGTSLPYPSAGNLTNSPSLAGGQDNQNDSLIAIQTKLGISASTPTNNQLLIGTGAGTSAWTKAAPTGTIVGTTDSQTLTNKILTSPTINSPVITNATITTDLITGFTVSNTGTVFGIPVTTGVIQTANTVSGASLVAASVGSTALAQNAVQANQLATNAITLGYASTTTLFSTASVTVVQVTSLSATVTIPAGGRRIKVTVSTRSTFNTTSGAYNTVSLWDGTVGSGTLLMESVIQSQIANGESNLNIIFSHVPASGSKTYNVGMKVSAGTGSITVGSPVVPMAILVEAI